MKAIALIMVFGLFLYLLADKGAGWLGRRVALHRWTRAFGVSTRWWESDATIRRRALAVLNGAKTPMEERLEVVPGVRSAEVHTIGVGHASVRIRRRWFSRKAKVLARVEAVVRQTKPIGVLVEIEMEG